MSPEQMNGRTASGAAVHLPKQFKCMYCKEDLDKDGMLILASGENIDLKCSRCGAVWKFWAKTQLNHKLVSGGKFNPKRK